MERMAVREDPPARSELLAPSTVSTFCEARLLAACWFEAAKPSAACAPALSCRLAFASSVTWPRYTAEVVPAAGLPAAVAVVVDSTEETTPAEVDVPPPV